MEFNFTFHPLSFWHGHSQHLGQTNKQIKKKEVKADTVVSNWPWTLFSYCLILSNNFMLEDIKTSTLRAGSCAYSLIKREDLITEKMKAVRRRWL